MSNQIDSLKKAQNALVENIHNESRNTLDMVFNSLVTNSRDTCSVLPEQIFVNYFLPFFTGRHDFIARPNIFSEWISIAGSPMNEVAIIDSFSNIMYYVPAVFDTSFINAAKQSERPTFSQITDHANLLNNNIPAISDRFLTDALSEKLPDITENVSVNTANERRWIEIFAKYKISLPSNTPPVVPSSLSNIDQDEVYE